MKHAGKSGKRAGPPGYRTPATFIHRKAITNNNAKMLFRRGHK